MCIYLIVIHFTLCNLRIYCYGKKKIEAHFNHPLSYGYYHSPIFLKHYIFWNNTQLHLFKHAIPPSLSCGLHLFPPMFVSPRCIPLRLSLRTTVKDQFISFSFPLFFSIFEGWCRDWSDSRSPFFSPEFGTDRMLYLKVDQISLKMGEHERNR